VASSQIPAPDGPDDFLRRLLSDPIKPRGMRGLRVYEFLFDDTGEPAGKAEKPTPSSEAARPAAPHQEPEQTPSVVRVPANFEKKVIEILRRAGVPVKGDAIARKLHRAYDGRTRRYLAQMRRNGLICRSECGTGYVLPHDTAPRSESA
jgi:hypothetical protein